MAIDVRKVLTTVAFRPKDMDALLDPNLATYARFDPEMGYVPSDVVLKDGIDGSHSTYTYEPGGQRRMVNYGDRPCRINTYGNSFTQCQQVSDDETWQERLAAHFGEPMRNFGSGGYGVYQAYRRAMLVEATDLAAEYVILNVWDDDHIRNLDAARWIRSIWKKKLPPEQIWPLHGLPWPHIRFDPSKGAFVEKPGLVQTEAELRKLTDPEYFYEAYKDDSMVHMFVLSLGGEAPTAELEAVAEALGVKVNLRDPETRAAEAKKLHLAYGFKSTEWVIEQMDAWAKQNDRKLMVLLSYGAGILRRTAEDPDNRFDQVLVDYLAKSDMLYVDCLTKALDDFKTSKLPVQDYFNREYISAAGAAVFGHYNPTGNHWFAFNIRRELVDWLNPNPPAYQD